MITVFNREQIYSTFDMEKQAKVRSLLSENNIKYQIKIENRRGQVPGTLGSQALTGSFGESPKLENRYLIFVHKDDLEKANYVLREHGPI